MELITVSGAGTLALLVALIADYVVAEDPRSAATLDGLASVPGAASPAATRRSR
jgi:hypothetical protein